VRQTQQQFASDSTSILRLLRGLACVLLDLRGGPYQPHSRVSSEHGEFSAEALAQFHSAEYASERNSVDVWKTLQYALVPIIFVVWSLLAQLRDTVPAVFLWWAGAAVVPVCYVAYQKAMVDALTGLVLIEEYVRPRAIALAGRDEFWFHEPVYRRRVKPDAAYGWFWPPLLSFAAPTAVLVLRSVMDQPFSMADWWRHVDGAGDLIGYAASCGVACFVGYLSKQGLALNRQISELIQKQRLSWL
jgi:hypothetical protein